MSSAMHTFLISVPQAAAIWVLLIMISVAVFAGLTARAARSPLSAAIRHALSAPPPPAARAEAADAARYAGEVAIAATQAQSTAARCREEWQSRADRSLLAWWYFEAADAAARRAARAAAYPVPATPQVPAEYAARERHLHGAATRAYRQGDLSREHLHDALLGRNGFDPRQHPVAQEVVLARAVRAHRLHAYRLAAEAERRAWQAADTAAAAASSLRVEAFAAAQAARHLAPNLRPERTGAARWLRPATLTAAARAVAMLTRSRMPAR